MKQIKCKAWDRRKEKMITDFTNYAGWKASDNMENVWHNERYEKLFWTGLKDKNSKEIYEKDIIGYSNKEFLHNQPKYLVYYAIDEGNYPAFDVKPRIEEISCNGLQFLIENYQIEVLGNKYEDPELLEQKNEQQKK